MLHICLIISVVCATGTTMPLPDLFSYSPAVGGGSGTEYSTAHEGCITGIKIWEYSGSYIYGLQLKYDTNWTTIIGSENGNPQVMEFYEKEYITQISGKYDSSYIYELIFVTNLGRFLKVGQPAGNSFNIYPAQRGSDLRFLSIRTNGWAIASIGAHWSVIRNCDMSVNTAIKKV
nr:zymogen granule membrane protein 16-like isoform X1 [Misgurnus anguillicaudatus]XP_055067285.1 zymogen granule membrane protein 16-like isoform X1 [Misgurnus anguillicaudatus]